MNIGTQLTQHAKGRAAETLAAQGKQVAKDLGSTEGIKVEQDSSGDTSVTVDTAALKSESLSHFQEARSKQIQANSLQGDANFTRGQAERDRANAREDEAEAKQAQTQAEESKLQADTESREKAAAEQEITRRETAKKEAETVALQEERAAQYYRTRGESLLAEAAGDPEKIAHAIDLLETQAMHSNLAEQSKIKVLTVDEVVANLKSNVSGLAQRMEDHIKDRGFFAENAHRALASASQEKSSGESRDVEANKVQVEANKTYDEASVAQSRANAGLSLAKATEAKVESAMGR